MCEERVGRDESDDKNEGECVNKGPSRVRARRAAVTLESPFYGSLNEALRSANRSDIKAFFHWYVGPMFQSQDNSTRSPHRQKHVLILASQVIFLILFDFSNDSAPPPCACRMKLALSGLYCLPLVQDTVHRGVKLDLKSKYPKGSKFVNWSFSSTTSSVEVLQSEQVCVCE